MAISIDNYKNVFSGLNKEIDKEIDSVNENIKNVFKSIKCKFDEIEKGGDSLKRGNETLKIGVVGQVKAGKSSFLNSLFFDGENVLPRASTPMTAGLTVLEYGDKNEFSVEYYNKGEWNTFLDRAKEYDNLLQEFREQFPGMSDDQLVKQIQIPEDIKAAKELVQKCARVAQGLICEKSKVAVESFSDVRDLQNVLEDYVGADGKYTSIVKCLTIKLNDERLKNLMIVDTPGVNDPVVSREMRTREFLRECHGVFFLSYSGRFFDSTDVSFLTGRIGSQGIGTVVLLASKFDSVLQDVGMKFKDDLGNAITDCQRQLRMQFERNLNNSDWRGEEPRLDYTSGIGYSIAKKPKGLWDDTEKHVVEQMERFYPSFFSDDEATKEYFLHLSQMDDLRGKYLEGIFAKNKEKIINDKVNGYFSNASGELKRIIKDGKGEIESRIKTLESGSLSGLKESRKAMQMIVDTIGRNINSLANVSDQRAAQYRKECWNAFVIDWNGNIPTTDESMTVSRDGWHLFSKKNIEIPYKKVDVQKLVERIIEVIDKACKSLNDQWKVKSEDLMKSIGEKVSEVINENEKNDTEAIIESDILRKRLDEILASMSNSRTINTSDIMNDVRMHLAEELQNLPEIKVNVSNDEAEAKMSIASQASNIEKRARETSIRIIGAVRERLNTALAKSAEETISVFKDRKDEFIDKVKESTSDYLAKLDADIKDKDRQLENYKAAKASLDRIGGMI